MGNLTDAFLALQITAGLKPLFIWQATSTKMAGSVEWQAGLTDLKLVRTPNCNPRKEKNNETLVCWLNVRYLDNDISHHCLCCKSSVLWLLD